MRRFVFILFIAFFTVPLLVLAGYVAAPGWTYPDLIPERFTWRGIGYLFADTARRNAMFLNLGSSVAYSLCTALLGFVLCLVPAHHLARHDFRGKALVEGLLLAPALVPAMTFSMGVHYLFIRTGLADSFLGIVLVLTTFSYPFMLRALVAGYQSFGREYEICAQNLGASRAMRFLYVDLPLLLPAAIAGGSVVFLIAFSEYFLVFLVGGGAVPSFTGQLFPFLNSSDRSVASGLTLVFLLVPILLFLVVELAVSRSYRARGMY